MRIELLKFAMTSVFTRRRKFARRSTRVLGALTADIVQIPVDDVFVITRSDLLLNPAARELHCKVRRMLNEFTFREPQLQFNLAPGLLEHTLAFRDRELGDASFFSRNLLGTAVAQGVDFAGSRLKFAVDVCQLRLRRR